MSWLRQLKESYWQAPQVDQLDDKLEPLRRGDTESAQQTPIERFMEVERDLGRMTLITQALIEACVRKGLLNHQEITDILQDVDLAHAENSQWGAAATDRPKLPLALVGNGRTLVTSGVGVAPRESGLGGEVDDFDAWGSDDEPTEVEGAAAASAAGSGGYDFGGGEIDRGSAIDVGGKQEENPATIPRTAPFAKPRKRKQSSALRQITGMLVSGFVGLLIGYFILLWFADQDIINAAPKLPGWMVPEKYRNGATAKSGSAATGGTATKNNVPAQELPGFEDKWGGMAKGGNKKNPGGGSPVFNPNESKPTPPKAEPGDLELTGPTSEKDPLDMESEESLKIDPPATEPGLGEEEEGPAKKPTLPAEEEESPAKEPTVPAEEEEPAPKKKPAPMAEEEEPAPDKNTVAKAETPREPKQFLIAGAKAATGQELGDAIRNANLATPDLTTGSLSDKELRAAKADAYRKFCELAQALTFVDGDPAADQLDARIPSAEVVAKMAIEESDAIFGEVGLMANQWFKGNTEAGIFLTGKVKGIEVSGDFNATTIDLDGKNSIRVITTSVPDVEVDDRVAVLGVIVDKPIEKIAGYSLPGGKVVWSEHVLKPEAPVKPRE